MLVRVSSDVKFGFLFIREYDEPLWHATVTGRVFQVTGPETAKRRSPYHARPHIGANGVSWPHGKMDEKLKSENMQKNESNQGRQL